VRRAADIDGMIAEVDAMIASKRGGARRAKVTTTRSGLQEIAPTKRKRRMSAAGRRKLSEAMKRRHASGEIARARKRAARARAANGDT